MMKVTLRISSLLFVLILWSATIWAQAPANDHCANAIELPIYNSEAEAILVSGDTRNTTDGSLDNIPVCSANFYRDDVWYVVNTPAQVSESGYSIKVYYTQEPADVPAFGMALYNSCDAVPTNAAFFCGNADSDVFYWNDQGLGCFDPNSTVYIRVWSAAGDAVNWSDGAGTFRIAIFPRPYLGSPNATVLWGDEPGEGDFAGGLSGWTAEGIACADPQPDSNALWTWSDSGWPYWLWAGNQTERLKSKTLCNGAMLFESMFMDIGPNNVGGSGTCPQDHEGALVSPVIDLSEFNSPGISVVFNQSMQRFTGGEHFLDFSIDGGATWDTIQINADKTALTSLSSDDAGYYNEEIRVRIPGAENSPNFRMRLRFVGGAYWWIVDDFRIIELPCNDLEISPNFFAIPQWAQIPENQVPDFAALADIENVGACSQHDVSLTFTVVDTATGNLVYNETLDYGSLTSDSLAQNKLFPELVDLPMTSTGYLGTYTLSSNAVDAEPLNNTISFYFNVGGSVFAHETGYNTGAAVNDVLYDDGAPLSFAFGNIFRPVNDATVSRIVWGTTNGNLLPGRSVGIYLIQWEDTNGDLIAEDQERRFVGLASYTFTGNEGPNAIIETVLENFDVAGAPVVMRADFQYMVIIETVALVGDPSLILLASNERDYSAQVLAMDSAFTHGLVPHRLFMTALGFAPDGQIANIDYEVRELGNDNRIFFGEDLIPLIRVVVESTNTKDELPIDNMVSVYPNPASEVIHVKLEFSNAFGDVQLRLLNPLGQTVYQKMVNATITNHVETISVSQLAAGNYLLQVETPEGQRSIPVVVVK